MVWCGVVWCGCILGLLCQVDVEVTQLERSRARGERGSLRNDQVDSGAGETFERMAYLLTATTRNHFSGPRLAGKVALTASKSSGSNSGLNAIVGRNMRW